MHVRAIASPECRSRSLGTTVLGEIIACEVADSLAAAFLDGRAGEIRLEVGADSNGQFTLMVSDNGVGFPEDLDFRSTRSLGLQLVNTLVEQLAGTIELDRSDGTVFMITFTELKYRERG